VEFPLSAFVIIALLILGFVFIYFRVLNVCCVWNGVCLVSVVFLYVLLLILCSNSSQRKLGELQLLQLQVQGYLTSFSFLCVANICELLLTRKVLYCRRLYRCYL
jgi:hypothetical protein